jgi:hypothetical protein
MVKAITLICERCLGFVRKDHVYWERPNEMPKNNGDIPRMVEEGGFMEEILEEVARDGLYEVKSVHEPG